MAADWKEYKLGELCDLIGGYAFKSQDFGNYSDKVIKITNINPPIVDASNLVGVNLSKYDYKKLEKYKVTQGDYVLAMTGATIGKLGKIVDDVDYYVNQRVLIFKPIGELVDKNYLFYCLLKNDFKNFILNYVDSETAQANISATTVGLYSCTIPNLQTQQKIAKILSSFDEKIELNNKINENLHAQAQAIFKSWFVDFEPFGGTMPSDWEEKKVCDVFDITIGKTPPRKELCWFSHKESDIRWLSISDMKNNDCYALTSSEYLTKEAIKKFNIKVVSDNTVLLSFKLTIGRVSIVCGEMATNEAIAHFNTDDKELVEYLYCYLKNYNYQSLGNTSSIATAVNSKIIKTIPFILPTREVIEDFHSIIVPYFGKIKNNILENIKLAQIRDTLLPKLMNGELEV